MLSIFPPSRNQLIGRPSRRLQRICTSSAARDVFTLPDLPMTGVVAPFLGGIGSAYAYYKHISTWRTRSFLGRALLSLNTVTPRNTILIRTLWERNVSDILLGNKHFERIVQRTGDKTTAEDPFLQFNASDSWFTHMAVLNAISEGFAMGHITADFATPGSPMHLPAVAGITRAAPVLCRPPAIWYCFGITRERYGENAKYDKLRIILIKEQTLRNWSHDQRPQNASSSHYMTHHVRWNTLRKFSENYREQHEREMKASKKKLGPTDLHRRIQIPGPPAYQPAENGVVSANNYDDGYGHDHNLKY